MQVALPEEVHDVRCTDCGADTVVNPQHTSEVNADDGKTNVSLLCSANCGWLGSVFSWHVSRAEYDTIYGHVPHDLLLPGDERLLPPPPEARTLPPGPWGAFEVQPSPIPDEAWEIPCPKEIVGPHGRKRVCSAILVPDPISVFFHDEFTSTTTLGFRCDVCQQPVLEHLSWPLTPEQHIALFGRAVPEYRPRERDPDDPDDFDVAYSMWRTADRAGLAHYPTAEDLAENYDLRSIQPGQYTIKHWSTGTEWDVPDFVIQHEQLVPTEYDEDADYDDETLEALLAEARERGYPPEVLYDVTDANAARQLLGMDNTQPWHPVRITWPDHTTLGEAVRGRDGEQARANAYWNWPTAASIVLLAEEDS